MLTVDIVRDSYVDSEGNLDSASYNESLASARQKAKAAAGAITSSISAYIKAATVTVNSTLLPSTIVTVGSPATQTGPVAPVPISGTGIIS